MSVRTALEIVFLAVMLAGAALSVIGILRARDTMAALHCASFASVAVTVPFAVAVAVTKLASMATIKTLLLLAIVLLTSPIASHALARAVYHRSRR